MLRILCCSPWIDSWSGIRSLTRIARLIMMDPEKKKTIKDLFDCRTEASCCRCQDYDEEKNIFTCTRLSVSCQVRKDARVEEYGGPTCGIKALRVKPSTNDASRGLSYTCPQTETALSSGSYWASGRISDEANFSDREHLRLPRRGLIVAVSSFGRDESASSAQKGSHSFARSLLLNSR